MILTNEQMFNSLAVLSNTEQTGMLGYAIAKNRRLLLVETQEYTKKRDELLMEFGVDKGNGNFELLPEQAKKFFEALEPYNELTSDVAVMQVSPEVFCGGSLTSSMMFTLDWMVKVE